MLVSRIVYEPAAFQLSRDGVIKQMGCGAVDHKPDDPRGIRHGVLLRFALRYRGKSEDADERKLGARRRDGADGALPAKRAGLAAGLQVFSVTPQRVARRRQQRDWRGELRVINGETLLQKLSDYSRGQPQFCGHRRA